MPHACTCRTAALALLGILAGCGGSDNNTTGSLSSYITHVSTLDGLHTATLKTGQPTSGSGPAATATASGVSIPGGSKQITVNTGSSFSAVVVDVAGVDGYYEITGLPSGTSVVIVVTMGQSPPQTFNLQAAAGSGTSYGTAAVVPITITSVGTGDVQVNVSWDADSDVDLHVVDPSSEEIFYGHRSSASGGSLDLDSNAACTLDHKRSENITWPSGQAPHGSYVVRVDYWSACSVTTTNYVVTVNVKGHDPQIFTGSFTAGDADGGATGSGKTITTFTY